MIDIPLGVQVAAILLFIYAMLAVAIALGYIAWRRIDEHERTEQNHHIHREPKK